MRCYAMYILMHGSYVCRVLQQSTPYIVWICQAHMWNDKYTQISIAEIPYRKIHSWFALHFGQWISHTVRACVHEIEKKKVYSRRMWWACVSVHIKMNRYYVKSCYNWYCCLLPSSLLSTLRFDAKTQKRRAEKSAKITAIQIQIFMCDTERIVASKFQRYRIPLN